VFAIWVLLGLQWLGSCIIIFSYFRQGGSYVYLLIQNAAASNGSLGIRKRVIYFMYDS